MLQYSLEELINSDLKNFKDFQSRKESRQKCCSELDSNFGVTEDGKTSVGVQYQPNQSWKGSEPGYRCIVYGL